MRPQFIVLCTIFENVDWYFYWFNICTSAAAATTTTITTTTVVYFSPVYSVVIFI